MLTQWRLIWRSISERRTRAVLTVIAVALGVAVMLSVQIALNALESQSVLAASLRAGQSGLDVRTSAAGGLSDDQLKLLASIHGVTAVSPLYEKRVIGLSLDPAQLAVTVNLISLHQGEIALRPLTVVAGRLPRPDSHSEIALATQLQSVFSVHGTPAHLGSTIILNTVTGPDRFTIVGLTDAPNVSETFTQEAIAVPEAELLSAFNLGLNTPLAALQLAPGFSAATVANAVHNVLGNDITTFDPSIGANPLAQLAPLIDMLTALAILIGAGVTANSISLSAAERRRDVGLLRAAGASQQQVFRLFIGESTIVALAGATIGSGLGILGGFVVIHLFSNPLLSAPPLSFSRQEAFEIAALGFSAALLGAALPALAAGRANILTALRPIQVASPGLNRRPPRQIIAWLWFFSLISAVIGGAWGVAAITAFLIGVGLLLPAATPRAAEWLARACAVRWRQAPLAAATIRWRGPRNATAVTGLVMAIAATVASAILVAGSLSASDAWIGKLFIGSQIVRSPVTESDQLAQSIATSSGNVAISELRFFPAVIDGDVVGITALDGNAYYQAGGLGLETADRKSMFAQLTSGPRVFVPQSLADATGWTVGQQLVATTTRGTVYLSVIAIADHSFPSGDGRESLIMDMGQARQAFPDIATGFDNLEILTSGHAAQVQSTALRYGLDTVDVTTIQSAARDAVNRAIGLILGISVLAIVIAMLAVINTLAMAIRQEARDVALLRAAGLSQRGGFRLLLGEGFLLATTAVAIGLASGFLIAIPMLRASTTPGFSPEFVVPWQLIAAIIVGSIVAVVAASAIPAYRVSRLSIVNAVHHE